MNIWLAFVFRIKRCCTSWHVSMTGVIDNALRACGAKVYTLRSLTSTGPEQVSWIKGVRVLATWLWRVTWTLLCIGTERRLHFKRWFTSGLDRWSLHVDLDCIYVCMYLCTMHVCMYVCMYLCMYVCISHLWDLVWSVTRHKGKRSINEKS